jgi:polyhydroxyalkanoate synthesis repressor PhaR
MVQRRDQSGADVPNAESAAEPKPSVARGRVSGGRKAQSLAQDAGAATPPTPQAPADDGFRVLKKYPNRRLYDTQTSAYITLADVKLMVLSSVDFVVRDAKSGEDLTRSILLQIILEEETGGVPMFTSQALAQIIRFYGHAMQGMMGSYLEKNLQLFTDFQTRVAEQTKGLYDPRLMAPDAWAKLMAAGPTANPVPNMMGSYLEQSKLAFAQMQEQLNKQAQTLFTGLAPFKPPKE